MKYVIMNDDTGDYYAGVVNEKVIVWVASIKAAIAYSNLPAWVMSELRKKGFSVTHIPVSDQDLMV